MSGLLYHLKLELYNPPIKGSESQIFLPLKDTDIFTKDLPSHRLFAPSDVSGNSQSGLVVDLGSKLDETTDKSHALLLPERNPSLRERATYLPAPSPEEAQRDWRYGPVTIDSIDMESSSVEKDTKAIYIPSQTKQTEVGWGVVHLYKDARQSSDTGLRTVDKNVKLDLDTCTTICILAVPSWMMPSDLLGFVGEKTREQVSHFRLIRTGRANKYMVLMKFRQAKKAREWQKDWNGRLFSAIEPENCHIVFVQSVQFVTPENVQDFPQNNYDPFMDRSFSSSTTLTNSNKPYAPPTPSLIELPTCPVCLERMDETTGLLTILCQHVFHCACLEKWKGSGCPVCRYIQVPSSIFPYPRPQDIDTDSDPACSTCHSTANLWICLICGSIGCGRYESAHAYAHYELTSHCYAMDISTQHVWDYAGDGYVHRLIQNKDNFGPSPPLDSTTRHIDMPHHPNTAYRSEPEDSVPRAKMEAMANEYTYLLSAQLDSQRRYFEEQVERAVDKASTATLRLETITTELSNLKVCLDETKDAYKSTRDSLDSLTKQMTKTDVRAKKFEEMARNTMKAIKEEQSLSSGMVERIRDLNEKRNKDEKIITDQKNQIVELEELNRDLTVFIQSRDELEKMKKRGEIEEDEVQDGQVGIQGKKNTRGRK